MYTRELSAGKCFYQDCQLTLKRVRNLGYYNGSLMLKLSNILQVFLDILPDKFQNPPNEEEEELKKDIEFLLRLEHLL